MRGSGRYAVPLTGVFGNRSETAYTGVLGTLMAGHGYVPLNRAFPVERTLLMLKRSMCRSLVVDSESEGAVGSVPGRSRRTIADSLSRSRGRY